MLSKIGYRAVLNPDGAGVLEKGSTKIELIRIDNQSAISIANSPQEKFRNKTKHISTKYHFIKKEIQMAK